jgi:arylsulfatase A-like enzyme
LGCSDETNRSAGTAREADPEPHTEASAEPGHVPAEAEPAREPNLLFITMDTTRADALGVYGQPRSTTPNLDRLASEGVLFDRVTTASPETLPSHATLFTGKWPYRHGVRSNAGYVLADRNTTLAEHLKSMGYRTAAEVAAPVLRQLTQLTQGFDEIRGAESPRVELLRIPVAGHPNRFETTNVRTGVDITRNGIAFLRRNRHQKFFLWLHYFDPHAPYAPPARFREAFPDSPYHAEVASTDHQIGLVVAELDRLQIRERTLIVVTADHGEGLGEHGESSHSYFLYDSTMRVPLVLTGLAGLPGNTRISSPVRTVDVAATALDLLGAPPLPEIDGTSLGPLIRGETDSVELTSYGEASQLLAVFRLPLLRFVSQGRWKYIHKVAPELYDVESDPTESRNLAAAHPEVVERLREQLETMLRGVVSDSDGSRAGIDSKTQEQLTALGYVAQGTGDALDDELASLELRGDDPTTKMAEVETLLRTGPLIKAGRHAEALALLEPIVKKNPESALALGRISEALQGLGRSREAVAMLARMYEVDRSNLTFLNNYAWALATHPDDEIRDGAKALEVARLVIANLPAPDPAHLDTLAAAQAESGDFEAARRTTSEAIELGRSTGANPALIRILQQHQKVLEAGKPIRDPAPG